MFAEQQNEFSGIVETLLTGVVLESKDAGENGKAAWSAMPTNSKTPSRTT
jgi:hypothetical protein